MLRLGLKLRIFEIQGQEYVKISDNTAKFPRFTYRCMLRLGLKLRIFEIQGQEYVKISDNTAKFPRFTYRCMLRLGLKLRIFEIQGQEYVKIGDNTAKFPRFTYRCMLRLGFKTAKFRDSHSGLRPSTKHSFMHLCQFLRSDFVIISTENDILAATNLNLLSALKMA